MIFTSDPRWIYQHIRLKIFIRIVQCSFILSSNDIPTVFENLSDLLDLSHTIYFIYMWNISIKYIFLNTSIVLLLAVLVLVVAPINLFVQGKKRTKKNLMFIMIYTVVEAKKRGKEKETPNKRNLCIYERAS
jgi:hypothetical protein